MEFLLVFALIVILMLCVGFGWGDILMLVLLVIAALTVLIGGFFLVCLALLLSSKKKRGVFSKMNEEGRFPCAVYDIDGGEFPNVFPCEMILRNKLYVPDKTVTLYYIKLRRAVIDKNAFITIIAGSAVFIPLSVMAAVMLVREISAFFG